VADLGAICEGSVDVHFGKRKERNTPAPLWGHEKRCKSLLYKEIKNPAPTEGAGHSQGERRLLVIRARENRGDARQKSHQFAGISSTRPQFQIQVELDNYSRKACCMPRRNEALKIRELISLNIAHLIN
jgi:hypothetical protein